MSAVVVSRMEPLFLNGTLPGANLTHHHRNNCSHYNSSSIPAGRGLLTVDKLAQQGSDQAPANNAPSSKAAGGLVILVILLTVVLLVGALGGGVLEILKRKRARQNGAGDINLDNRNQQNGNLVSRSLSALSKYWRTGGVRRGVTPDPRLTRNVESSEGIGSTAIALRDLEVGHPAPRPSTPPTRTRSFPPFPFTRHEAWPERSAASSPVEVDSSWPAPKDLVIYEARAPEQIEVIPLQRIRSHHAQFETMDGEAPVANPFVIDDDEEDVEYEQTLTEIRHFDNRTSQDRQADEWHEISLD